MIIDITIPGKPIAKKRPRFFVRGKHVGAYNPQVTEEGKFILQVQETITKHIPEPTDKPVKLKMLFCFIYPESWSWKKRLGTPDHESKPDLDNLLKFVMDCLNGVLYRDDKQVMSLQVDKVYYPRNETNIQAEIKE